MTRDNAGRPAGVKNEISKPVGDLINTWQKRMFWLMWTTYASFYLLRVNISVAMPKIMEEHDLPKLKWGSC